MLKAYDEDKTVLQLRVIAHSFGYMLGNPSPCPPREFLQVDYQHVMLSSWLLAVTII